MEQKEKEKEIVNMPYWHQWKKMLTLHSGVHALQEERRLKDDTVESVSLGVYTH